MEKIQNHRKVAYLTRKDPTGKPGEYKPVLVVLYAHHLFIAFVKRELFPYHHLELTRDLTEFERHNFSELDSKIYRYRAYQYHEFKEFMEDEKRCLSLSREIYSFAKEVFSHEQFTK